MIGRWAKRFATATETPLATYSAVLAAVGAAAVLRAAVGLAMADPPNFMAFYPAVLFGALVGGLRGGLVAVAASALTVWLFWLPKPPLGDWKVQSLNLILFAVTASASALIGEGLRVAIRRGVAIEERFRIFQEQALDAFVILEPVLKDGVPVDFVWTYANDAAQRLSPSAEIPLLGRRITEVFPGATGEETVRRMARVMRDGGPDQVEVERTLNGRQRWLRSSAVRLQEGVAATYSDVTDKHESEAAAVRALEQFRNMANAAPVLIWMSGQDQKASWFNTSWLDFTGRTLDEELGRGWMESVHPDDRDALQAAYAQHFATRSPGRMEYRMRRRDGQYRWIDEAAAPSYDADGTFIGYVGSCVDVTDRRVAEAALREGEARMRALVESLPQLLWSNRADGFCDFLSPQWIAFTGVPAERHLGGGWLDAVHPEDRDLVQEAWAQAVKGGLPFDVEYRLRRHDGVYRWFAGRAAAVRDEQGAFQRWFGTSSDITEIVEARRHLEERVAERTRALEASLEERARAEAALAQAQRLETVGRLTGGVAHDFNNLLTVVIGGLDMILKHPEDPARVARLAEAAMSAGRRGERLTRQLLTFSRTQELKLETVSVGALVEQLEPLARRAVAESIEIIVDCPADLGFCRVDPAQFESAILNLVVNAADSVGRSGRIEVRGRRRTLAAGEAPGASAGDHVSVTVTDTGAGMTPEVMARAFEPFFTTKDVGKGTGLGLAQVYGFVRQAGGAVTLDSRPGEGATVTILLPLAEAGAPAAEPVEERLAPAGIEGVRILLVEDDAAVRALTETLLSELGCEVAAEADGAAALRRLRTGESFDLLLSDIIMPGGMSGVDLAREARASDPDLPIVLTTGYAGDRFEAGADAVEYPVLRKPFRAEQLASAVREAIEPA